MAIGLESSIGIVGGDSVNYLGLTLNNRYIRGKKYWSDKQTIHKEICATILTEQNGEDHRPFLNVEIAGEIFKGLLDSGASISCLGNGVLDWLPSVSAHWTHLKSSVRTADGNPQPVLGYLDTFVKCGNVSKSIRLYIVPGLTQRLYLGIDFWRSFGIVPMSVDGLSGDLVEIDDDVSVTHCLTSEQQRSIDLVKQLFPNFAVEGLGRTNLIKHQIDVGDAKPIKQRHYPISPAVQKLVDSEIDRMLSLNVIEESKSAWSSPIVMVRKANGKPRLCLDSRKLNSVTKKDAYPLPKIDGHLGRLSNTRFISSIDLKDAFWQVELDEESRQMTAFSIPGRPLYQFRTMPFGLCNAAQSMCRLMDKVIPHEYHDRIFVYIDDLLIVSADFDTHVDLLKLTAKWLRNANLTINIDKSKFCLRELKYLGFIIGDGCIKVDQDKISGIVNFPEPKTVRQLRRFLGMAGWYRRFIMNFSSIAAPLTDLISTKVKLAWNSDAQSAFEKLKFALSTAPLLSHPNFDKRFYIQCDASMYGIGSVLFQLSEDGKECPIAYLSQKLNAAQRNYSVTELECLAAVISVKKFRPYIEGMPFTIITDHASLKWLMDQTDLSGRLARWSLKLQCFDFTIEHRRGKLMVVPDTLSRAFEDEIGEIDTQFVLDLESDHFVSGEYAQKRQTISDNLERFPDLKIDDNLIFRRTVFRGQEEGDNENSLWKLWIPSDLVRELVQQAHDPPTSAHCGIAKTLAKLRRFYYWPKMAVDVQRHIGACIVCKETKAPNVALRPFMGEQFTTERPFEQLYIDLLGPYPRSKSGNVFILIVLDHFSKFVLLKPLRNATASLIVKFLESEVLHLFGVPNSILSDNGKQFVSRIMNDLCKTYGIRQIFTAIHSPQANASERVNRSILAAIRAYIGADHSRWDEKLTEIASALRNTIHVTTGHSAHYLVFGRHMVTHASQYKLLKKLDVVGSDIQLVDPDDMTQLIGESVRKNMRKAHEKGTRVYNTRAREVEYSPGQEIFYRNFSQSDFEKGYNAKLANKFIRARIKRKLGHARYELEDLGGKLIKGVFHAKDIRQ